MVKTKSSSAKNDREMKEGSSRSNSRSNIIDRNVLTKEQHLRLLSTPKWKPDRDDEESEDIDEFAKLFQIINKPKRSISIGRRLRRAEITFMHNFLAEIWAFFTPDMTDNLKGMLMNEFGMSPREAYSFLQIQRKYTPEEMHKKSPRREKNNKKILKPGIFNHLKTRTSLIVRDELEAEIISFLCEPKLPRNLELARNILKQINDISGEDCALEDPKTPTQRIMVIGSVKVADWLADVVEESDISLLEKKEGTYKEDGKKGKGDGAHTTGDVGKEAGKGTDKDRSPGTSAPRGAGGDGGPEDDQTGEDSQQLSREGSQEKDNADGSKGEGKAQNSPEEDSKGEGKNLEDDSKGGSKSPEGDSRDKDDTKLVGPSDSEQVGKDKSKGKNEAGSNLKKDDPNNQKVPDDDDKQTEQNVDGSKSFKNNGSKTDDPKTENKDNKDDGDENTKKYGDTKSDRPSADTSSKDRDYRKSPVTQSRRGSKPESLKKGYEHDQKKNENKDNGNKKSPKTHSTDRDSESTEEEQLGKNEKPYKDKKRSSGHSYDSKGLLTEADNPETKVNDVLKAYLADVVNNKAQEPTARQEALDDIISKKLETKVNQAGRPMDDQMAAAITTVSNALSSHVDQLATQSEWEYGARSAKPPVVPVSQKGKGPTFSISRGASGFEVKPVNHINAYERILHARGFKDAKPITFDSKEAKDWARWASDVTTVAQKWRQWVDSTVKDVVDSNESRRLNAKPKYENWGEWKKTTLDKTLEWNQDKKLLDEQASNLQKRAEGLRRVNASTT